MTDPRQLTLDDAIAPCGPSVTAEEAPRLSRQSAAILARLQQGPATNAELAAIALKYTGRCSDARRAGHDIRVIERDYTTGRVLYGLFVSGQMVRA